MDYVQGVYQWVITQVIHLLTGSQNQWIKKTQGLSFLQDNIFTFSHINIPITNKDQLLTNNPIEFFHNKNII